MTIFVAIALKERIVYPKLKTQFSYSLSGEFFFYKLKYYLEKKKILLKRQFFINLSSWMFFLSFFGQISPS